MGDAIVDFVSPAVVVGLDVNGLGVVRALHRGGVPTVALDTDFDKPTAATRFPRKIRISSLAGPEFISELLELQPRLGKRPFLILTHEESVATISLEREKLAGKYLFSMPSHAVMTELLDKCGFQALAERLGFPIPRAVRVTPALGTEATRDLRFPCVLKPPHKHAGYANRFVKAYKVNSEEEVGRLWSQMQEVVDEILVQEWIEGGDSDVYFCLQYRGDRGPSVSFVGRKVCQWPPLVGGTASCMPAPEASAELIALTDRFFAAVGFVGIGSMEYKRDTRDGRFYMVEPTVGRTDYQEEIAALNGVNIPLAAYRMALGEAPPPAIPASPPRAWRDPDGYAQARRAGAPDPMSRLAPGIRVSDAYFRIDDPMPLVVLKLAPLRRRLCRGRRRALSSSRAKSPAGKSQDPPVSAP